MLFWWYFYLSELKLYAAKLYFIAMFLPAVKIIPWIINFCICICLSFSIHCLCFCYSSGMPVIMLFNFFYKQIPASNLIKRNCVNSFQFSVYKCIPNVCIHSILENFFVFNMNRLLIFSIFIVLIVCYFIRYEKSYYNHNHYNSNTDYNFSFAYFHMLIPRKETVARQQVPDNQAVQIELPHNLSNPKKFLPGISLHSGYMR